MPGLSAYVTPVLLLCASNVFYDYRVVRAFKI